MKKSVLTALAVCICLAVAGIAQAATWKISHVRPQDTAIDKDLHWFADNVKEATNGKLKVKVYPASSLGDYTVVQERVSVGAIEMACQPVATAADKRFNILYFPYLVNNYTQAEKNFATGSPLRGEISEMFGRQDIEVLAAWPVYFGGIALNAKPNAPGNPDASQGLKLRVPPMKTFQLLADNIGYMATPLPFSEAFTAVQTGVVDGVIGSGAEGYYASFRDVTKYYLPLNTHFEVWYLIANKEMVEDLDDAERQQLREVAQRFEKRRWESVKQDQELNEKRLADYGAEILTVSDEQIARTAEIVQAKVWPAILEDVGTEWGKSVLDKIIK